MTHCERIRADAPGLMTLPATDPERASALAHAAGCPGCEKALRDADRLQALLGEVTPAPLPASALARATQAIEQELRREQRRRSLWSAGAAAALMAVLVGLARHRNGSTGDWLVAGGVALVALALAALSVRRPLVALAGGAAAALAAAVATGGPGALEPGTGLHCLFTELGAAAAVVGAGWLALRGGATSPARWTVAAAAAAGALAGGAALEVTCSAHGALSHDVVFHLGGVVLAAGLASLLGRRHAAAVA